MSPPDSPTSAKRCHVLVTSTCAATTPSNTTRPTWSAAIGSMATPTRPLCSSSVGVAVSIVASRTKRASPTGPAVGSVSGVLKPTMPPIGTTTPDLL
ncbi:MAG: hypothetical protein AAFV88_06585 [Planctomycetota bacterium]